MDYEELKRKWGARNFVKKTNKKFIALISVILIIIASATILYFFVKIYSSQPQIIGKTITTNYSELSFETKPYKGEYYALNYKNERINLIIYYFNDKDEVNKFFDEFLSAVKNQTKIIENVDIEKYSGTLLESESERTLILKVNKFLIACGGNNLNDIKEVVRWYLRNYY